MQKSIYQILEGVYLPHNLGKIFAWSMAGLIILNVLAVLVATEHHVYLAYENAFFWLEVISIILFSLEYIARVWSCLHAPEFANMPSWKARMRYILSPMALFDLMAILPALLTFMSIGVDLRILRALRLLRLLKLTRYSRSLQLLGNVMVAQRRELGASVLVMVVLLIFTSTGMYLLERTVQPDAFSSIPRAMWWAMATLTTVGYGDVSPVTPLGQIFGAFAMVLGIGMFALPTGILATGFTEELRRHDFVVHWKTVARVPFFNQLDAVEIADISSRLLPVTLRAGERLIQKGADADRMYFLIQGKLEMNTGQEKIHLTEPGSIVGELALLEEAPRFIDVDALTDCRLLTLLDEDLQELMARNDHMRDVIKSVATERLGRVPKAFLD